MGTYKNVPVQAIFAEAFYPIFFSQLILYFSIYILSRNIYIIVKHK